jgi:hypothetical protein
VPNMTLKYDIILEKKISHFYKVRCYTWLFNQLEKVQKFPSTI